MIYENYAMDEEYGSGHQDSREATRDALRPLIAAIDALVTGAALDECLEGGISESIDKVRDAAAVIRAEFTL